MGKRRKAFLMSSFARRVPGPRVGICLMAASTVMQLRLHSSLGIASLMLAPCGCDRSTISHHLPSNFFGTTPNLLTWASGMEPFLNGPAMQHSFNLFAKYSSTTMGCSSEEARFLRDDLSVCKGVLQPHLKPDVIPSIKKFASFKQTDGYATGLAQVEC